MNRHIAAVMCSVVLAVMTFSSHAVAQQRTAKACQEEWRAKKAANQANGVTEKAYVAQCRGGGPPTAAPATPAAPSPAPTAAAPPVRPSATVAGQKTAKACRDEWRANKPANQASGITEKAYVEQCRGGGTAAQSPPPTPAAQTPAAAPAAPSTPAASAPAAPTPAAT